MKKIVLPFLCVLVLWSCKHDTDKTLGTAQGVMEKDTIIVEVPVEPIKKSVKEIKAELKVKGIKSFDYINKETQDTILMQQYFMAFLKKSAIHVQNEEENERLNTLHLKHLSKMYELGYADISGPFEDNKALQGVTIYNVPTLKMADSLAHADPMVQAKRLEVEVHPWWAPKGFSLR